MRKISTLNYKILKDFLLSGRHIHPLVILLVDLIIVFCSFSLSYFIFEGFIFVDINIYTYLFYAFSFCLVAFPVIYLGRLHTGLLRFSNTIDLFRVFAATFTFTIVFLV